MDEISGKQRLVICRRRAGGKLAVVGAGIALVLVPLLIFVRERALNGLVNHLTLGLLVALIVIVNLVCCLIIMVLFAAWRWIKRDLVAEED